jgi:ribosomal protein L37AE/L43A
MGILRNIRDVVKNMKHSYPNPKLCPRCGSHNLRLTTGFDIWLFPEQYVCQQCGYKGAVTLELEKIEDDEAQSGSSKPS